MTNQTAVVSPGNIGQFIRSFRGQRVILDNDLAALYTVPTKRLNEQYRRNLDRFPEDFAFRLNRDEWEQLRSQSGTLGAGADLRSQDATSRSHGGRRYLPVAFTEHGALMAANILASSHAATISGLYHTCLRLDARRRVANAAILKRLAEIDKTLLLRDSALCDNYQRLRPLLEPPPTPPKPEMGFRVKEDSLPYRTKRNAARY
jgi:broad specificity phosphatase PhoE